MSVLAQSGRSERFGAIEICDALDALSILEAQNVTYPSLQLDAAGAPAAVGIEECDYLVAGIEQLLKFLTEVLPLLRKRGEIVAHAGVAPNGAAAE